MNKKELRGMHGDQDASNTAPTGLSIFDNDTLMSMLQSFQSYVEYMYLKLGYPSDGALSKLPFKDACA